MASACATTDHPTQTKAPTEAERKAFAETKAKAEQGGAASQTNLGFMYEKGQGVKQDYPKAFVWYTKAAEQNEPYA